VKQINEKRLVYLVAKDFQSATGKLPPRTKDAWFALFASELGSYAGFACRPALVEATIKAMARNARFADTVPNRNPHRVCVREINGERFDELRSPSGDIHLFISDPKSPER
jgi:hypothetical protein